MVVYFIDAAGWSAGWVGHFRRVVVPGLAMLVQGGQGAGFRRNVVGLPDPVDVDLRMVWGDLANQMKFGCSGICWKVYPHAGK